MSFVVWLDLILLFCFACVGGGVVALKCRQRWRYGFLRCGRRISGFQTVKALFGFRTGETLLLSDSLCGSNTFDKLR